MVTSYNQRLLPKDLYEGVCSELENFYSEPILNNHGISYHIFVNQSVGVYPKTSPKRIL